VLSTASVGEDQSIERQVSLSVRSPNYNRLPSP
jgi:hypothetical protein